MKTKKHGALIAILLIATVMLGAAAAGLSLPTRRELSGRRHVAALEKAYEQGGQEAYLKALGQLTDQALLDVVLEAAKSYEAGGAQFFSLGQIATQRIAPLVDPALLEQFLLDPELPESFKTFMLEVTLYVHGTDGDHADKVKRILKEEQLSENLTVYLIVSVDWDMDSLPILRDIYESSSSVRLQGLALRTIAVVDKAGTKNELYHMVEHYQDYDEALLHDGVIALVSVGRLGEPPYQDAPQVLLTLCQKLLTEQHTVTANHVNSILNLTGGVMSETNTKGLFRLLYEYQDKVPNLHHVLTYVDEMIYPEIDEMLLSDNEEEARFALEAASLYPMDYYNENLQTMARRHPALSEQATKLIDFTKEHTLPNSKTKTQQGGSSS